MPEPINEKPELYVKSSTGFKTLKFCSIVAGAVAVPFLVPVVMAAAATIPVVGATAWAASMVATAVSGIAGGAAVGGLAVGAVSAVTGLVQSFKSMSGACIEVNPRDGPIKKENLRFNRIEVH
jgi:hypothetical protein